MGKFSTGLFAGAMLGVGLMAMDKRSIKRVKRMMRKLPHHPIHF